VVKEFLGRTEFTTVQWTITSSCIYPYTQTSASQPVGYGSGRRL